jgi:hypothetical protein
VTDRRRVRARRRRRLIALVVAIDALGAAALAVALTYTSDGASSRPAATQVAGVTLHGPGWSITFPGRPAVTAPTTTAPGQTQPQTMSATVTARAPRHRPHSHTTAAAAGGDAQASFAQFVAAQPGSVGVAVSAPDGGPISTFGSVQLGHAWSTMKVPVLTTLLRADERSNQSLSGPEQSDATAALEASDNSAAEALFSVLEAQDGGVIGASSAVSSTLQAAGDPQSINTAPNSGGFTTWGQTEWSASGEVEFYRTLAAGCLLSPQDTRYVLGLMAQVEPDQRWGGGTVNWGMPVAFKGGWGPEVGGHYLVRQSVLVGSASRGIVFSMLARPSDGTLQTGTQMVSDIAAWVSRTWPQGLPGAGAGC